MSASHQFELAPSSIIDALYASVRHRIINGDIRQGERLTEARISTEYNVARPTAKACLERLVGVGLLERSAHKTAIVPRLGRDDITDLFAARGVVEEAAVELIAQHGVAPASVRRAQADMEASTRSGNFDDKVAADTAFHLAIVRESRSPRLARLYETILGEIQLTMGLYSAHSTAPPALVEHEHGSVIAAIDAGDGKLAAERLRRHLRAAEARVLSNVADEAPSGG